MPAPETLEKAKLRHEAALRNLQKLRGLAASQSLSPEKRALAQKLVRRQEAIVKLALRAEWIAQQAANSEYSTLTSSHGQLLPTFCSHDNESIGNLERAFLPGHSTLLEKKQLLRSAIDEFKQRRYSLANDLVNEAIEVGLPKKIQKVAERLWSLIAAEGAPGSPRESPLRRIERGNRWLAEIEKQVPIFVVEPAEIPLPEIQEVAPAHLADLSREVPRTEINAATRSGLKVSGVYSIEIAATGGRYIGSAIDIGVRWRAHLWVLRRGKHWNRTLQHAFYDDGLQAFRFRILEAVDDQWRLAEREEFYFSQTQHGILLNSRTVALRPDISWEESLLFEYRERLSSESKNAGNKSPDIHSIKNEVVRQIARSMLDEGERRYPVVGKVLDDLIPEVKIAIIRGQARTVARERQK